MIDTEHGAVSAPSPRLRGEGWGEGRTESADPHAPHPAPASRAADLSPHAGRDGRIFCSIGVLAILTGLAGVTIQPIVDAARLTSPAPTPIISDRNGTFITQIGHETRERRGETQIDYGYWPLKTLPDRVVRATLALEDRRFATHIGVDPLALARATWSNANGRRRSGASTIAMQVARMQNPAPRTLATKLREGVTAIALTLRYGRENVLAHYLRLVPYGNGSHGIAHAARIYFDKPVDDLSWAEIALLAAIPQSPTLTNPLHARGLARAIRRGHHALEELARQGVIDEPDAALAHRQLAAMRPPPLPARPDALHAALRFEQFLRDGRLRYSADDPRLTATLDLRLQNDIGLLARRALNSWRSQGAEQVAALIVERASGRVLASVGSGGYAQGHSGAIDFSRVPRSPGSTLKPFIYALALERGFIRASDTLADLPEGASWIGNADGQFLGPMLPRQALANSRNVPATNLLRTIGLNRTFGFLHGLGLHDIAAPADTFGLSMAIGSLPTTLEKLVRAYGVLANDGKLADLTWIDGQRTRDPLRLLSTDTARLVQSMLADASARLPTFPRYGPTEYPFPVALKTGTSQGFRDAWTVAWSSDVIVGVWLGRADAGTMTKLSGANSAARLAHAIMLRATRTKPGEPQGADFPAPPGRVPVELCTFGGRSDGGCGQTLTEWLRPDELPALVPVASSENAAPQRPSLTLPVAHRAWAENAGFRIADAEGTRLAVVAPEADARIWINPDTPTRANRIALKAHVSPKVAQVVWYVDGAPFALAGPDEPVWWPLTRGAHRFQVRLPLQNTASDVVHVNVE